MKLINETKYKSNILKAIHNDAKAMYEVGGITNERMQEYDKMCLVCEPQSAYESNSTQRQSIPAFAAPSK